MTVSNDIYCALRWLCCQFLLRSADGLFWDPD